MASENDNYTRIQMRTVFIIIIGVVTGLLFITSAALIAIGYMNPFGTTGLGFLGGGTVLYFLTILLLCGSFVWVNNKYPGNEPDKHYQSESSTDEIFPLKLTAKPIPSPLHVPITGLHDFPTDELKPVSETTTRSPPTSPPAYSLQEKLLPDKNQEKVKSDKRGPDIKPYLPSSQICIESDLLLLQKCNRKGKDHTNSNPTRLEATLPINVQNYKLEVGPAQHINRPMIGGKNQNQIQQINRKFNQFTDSAGTNVHFHNGKSDKSASEDTNEIAAEPHHNPQRVDQNAMPKDTANVQSCKPAGCKITEETEIYSRSTVQNMQTQVNSTTRLLPSNNGSSLAPHQMYTKVGRITTVQQTDTREKPAVHHKINNQFEITSSEFVHGTKCPMPKSDLSRHNNAACKENMQDLQIKGLRLFPDDNLPKDYKPKLNHTQDNCMQERTAISLQSLEANPRHKPTPVGEHHTTQVTKGKDIATDLTDNKRHAWAIPTSEF